MEFLNFLRQDPVMAWFAALGLLVVVVPLAWVLWGKMTVCNPDATEKPAVQAGKSVPFGNRTELVILLFGLLLLLAVIGWVRSAFFS